MPAGAYAGAFGELDLYLSMDYSWWIETTVDRLFSHRLQLTMPPWDWGVRAQFAYF